MKTAKELFDAMEPTHAANIAMYEAASIDYLDAMMSKRAFMMFEKGYKAAREEAALECEKLMPESETKDAIAATHECAAVIRGEPPFGV